MHRTCRLFTAILAANLVAAAALAQPAGAQPASGDTARSDADCVQLLERWAGDPKAAPKRAIDQCKQQLGAAAEPDGRREALAAAAPLATLDPCSGPNAANSVECWGPWGSIAPAAAGPVTSLEVPDPGLYCDSGSGLADQCVAQIQPTLPVAGCTPGTPCGFATIVSGVTSDGAAEDTEFGRFDLAPDGTRFSVAPESGGSIDSVPMTAVVTPQPDGYGNMRSSGADGAVNSRLVARVVQDDEGPNNGQIQLGADIWTHGTREDARSGYFAWGTATSQAGLDTLNAGNVSLNFTGPMSVNNATTGNMTLNFGANPNWTGTWTNPAWSFGAGGTVTGANLISQPGQFTSNVTGSGSFVQGAIVGEAGGPRGITHIIDVTLEGQGRIKDVGLLRDVVAPVAAP